MKLGKSCVYDPNDIAPSLVFTHLLSRLLNAGIIPFCPSAAIQTFPSEIRDRLRCQLTRPSHPFPKTDQLISWRGRSIVSTSVFTLERTTLFNYYHTSPDLLSSLISLLEFLILAMGDIRSPSSSPAVSHNEHVEEIKLHKARDFSDSDGAYAEHGAGIDHQITQDRALQANPELLWSRVRHSMREPFSEFFGVFILVLFGDG